jgi:hypothetical protein
MRSYFGDTTLEVHHFVSLTHKEPEPFLREDLSHSFRMADSR